MIILCWKNKASHAIAKKFHLIASKETAISHQVSLVFYHNVMSHLKHIFLKNLFLILKNKIILFKMLLKVPFVSFKGKVSLPTSMLNIVRKGGVAHSNPPLIYIPFLDLDLKVFQTDTGSKPLLDLDSQNRCNLTKSLDFQDPNLKQIQLNSCLPPIFWIENQCSPSKCISFCSTYSCGFFYMPISNGSVNVTLLWKVIKCSKSYRYYWRWHKQRRLLCSKKHRCHW